MTAIEEIMDSSVYKDLEARLRAAVNSLFDCQMPSTSTSVEILRTDIQAKYDMMYEAGMIPVRPTVSVTRFILQSGVVDFNVDFPETIIKFLVPYTEDDTENSAIDSPLDKP